MASVYTTVQCLVVLFSFGGCDRNVIGKDCICRYTCTVTCVSHCSANVSVQVSVEMPFDIKCIESPTHKIKMKVCC